MAYERGLFERQVSKLVDEQLSEWNAAVVNAAQDMARSVENAAWGVGNHDALRRQIRKDGRVRQFFILGTDGQFVYPTIQHTMTQGERDFIERTRTVWESGAIAPQRSNDKVLPGQSSQQPPVLFWGSRIARSMAPVVLGKRPPPHLLVAHQIGGNPRCGMESEPPYCGPDRHPSRYLASGE